MNAFNSADVWAFLSAIRLLAQFAREPISRDYKVAAERSYSLREAINNHFDAVRASADGVLFEFGPSRQQDLAWRSRFRQWQPQLRLLFITEIALWKYRAQLPGFELPKAVILAQQEFDDQSAKMLNGIADKMEGKPSMQESELQASYEHLEAVSGKCCLGEREVLTPQLEAFLVLSLRIQGLETWLDQEIRFD